MGSTEEGATFFDSLWPGARGIADPDKRVYAAFGVERGGMAEMFGPGAIACGIRATMKGNLIGRKQGDPWTLPTFVLVSENRVLWRHDGRHAGDHPAWADIAAMVNS